MQSSPETPPGVADLPANDRRARRYEHRRTEILAAAAHVFSEKGYAGATTKDIANALDIGESTLYSYFTGKRDILMAIIEHKRDEMDDFMATISQVEDLAGLKDFLGRILIHWFERIDFTRTLMGEAWLNPEIYALVGSRLKNLRLLIANFLEHQMDAGVFRRMDSNLASRIIICMYAGIVLPVLFCGQTVPSPEQCRIYAEELSNFIMYALLPNGRDGHFPETAP